MNTIIKPTYISQPLQTIQLLGYHKTSVLLRLHWIRRGQPGGEAWHLWGSVGWPKIGWDPQEQQVSSATLWVYATKLRLDGAKWCCSRQLMFSFTTLLVIKHFGSEQTKEIGEINQKTLKLTKKMDLNSQKKTLQINDDHRISGDAWESCHHELCLMIWSAQTMHQTSRWSHQKLTTFSGIWSY